MYEAGVRYVIQSESLAVCFASRAVLRMRQRAYAAGVGTNHWPHEFWPNAPLESLELIEDSLVAQVLKKADPRVRSLVG